MGRFVFAVILLIIGAIAFGGAKAAPAEVRNIARRLAIAPLAIGLLLLLLSPLRIVGAGQAGVKICLGEVNLTEAPSGVTVVAPWCDLKEVSIRTEVYAMVARSNEGDVSGDDSLVLTSSDSVSLRADVSVLFHIESSQAAELFQQVSDPRSLIRNEARSGIRDAGSQFAAIDIIGQRRAEVSVSATEILAKRLQPYGVVLESVQIRDVHPSDEGFARAIADKVAKQQAAQAKEFELQAALKDAEIARTKAQGDADAQRIRNSVDPTPAQLRKQEIEAIKPTDKTIITNGSAPIIVNGSTTTK